MNELQPLIDELDDPNLTEARWRELMTKAEPIVNRLQVPEYFEPFLIAGSVRGWDAPSEN